MTTSQAKLTPEPQTTKSPGLSREPLQLSIEEREVDAVCNEHGQFHGIARKLLKTWHEPQCPQCADARAKGDAENLVIRERAMKAAHVRRLIGASGVPPRFEGRTFDNYRAVSPPQDRAKSIAADYAARFEERLKFGGGLAFCGKPGTGKTHLACAIANTVMRTGRTAAFMTVIRAVRTVKDTFRRDSEISEQDAINRLATPDLLILDEVGVQFGSETEKLILFEIINTRYEHFRPTILISNLASEELGEYVGTRTVDRMREGGGAVIAFEWNSYRSKVASDDGLPAQDVKPVNWEKLNQGSMREIV